MLNVVRRIEVELMPTERVEFRGILVDNASHSQTYLGVRRVVQMRDPQGVISAPRG